MKKKLMFIASGIFLLVFLIWPAYSYRENYGGCPNNPYANCAPGYTTDKVEVLGGVKYLKHGFDIGSYQVGGKVLVENKVVSHGGYYDSELWYFQPDWAFLGALIFSILIVFFYSRFSKRKTKEKK
jgi:hypothetical protein